jgi:hypothetical protein
MLQTTTAAVIESISHKNKYIMEDVKEEGFEAFVERERQFMKAVLDGFEKWSKEANNIVLWDVDDTLGKVLYLGNDGNERVWYLRPAMQILVPYLKEHYPNVKNGFITNRKKTGIPGDFEKYSDLFSEYPFFDFDLAYSVRDMEMTHAQENEICDKFQPVTNRVNSDFAHKYQIVENLKLQNPDVHYRIIDDNAIAMIAGEDGVDVYYMMPKMS